MDFYEEQVLPAAFARLDAVFPGLGLKRKGRGWTATNRETTEDRFNARPDRVVCNRPGGFLVHGETPSPGWPIFEAGPPRPKGPTSWRP